VKAFVFCATPLTGGIVVVTYNLYSYLKTLFDLLNGQCRRRPRRVFWSTPLRIESAWAFILSLAMDSYLVNISLVTLQWRRCCFASSYVLVVVVLVASLCRSMKLVQHHAHPLEK